MALRSCHSTLSRIALSDSRARSSATNRRSVKLGVTMDFPVSWTPSMLTPSAIMQSVGHNQPPIVTMELTTATSMVEPANSYTPSVHSVASLPTPSLISDLHMSSSNGTEQQMRPITSNMGMHIPPMGPTAANEESSDTIFVDQEALFGSYAIYRHSMEGTPMISRGIESFVPAAQNDFQSAQSTVMSVTPLSESYIPPFNSFASLQAPDPVFDLHPREQEMRPITSNMRMHILPMGPIAANEESPNPVFVEREALFGSYSIDLYSKEETSMISRGMESSAPAAQSAQSTVMSMAPVSQSYIPAFTSVASLQTPSLISDLHLSSSNGTKQAMGPITSNMGMHIPPMGPTAANEESSNTIFVDQEALFGSYAIYRHSMEGTPMISRGNESSVPVAQSVFQSAQSTSTVMTVTPLSASYIPPFNSFASLQASDPIFGFHMPNEQEMRPITSNMGMHILPVGPIEGNEESSVTIFVKREALSGSYSIDLHSMEGIPMISRGIASSVPAAQSVFSSAQSTVMSMAPLIESYAPPFTSASSNVDQNLGLNMRQLQGGPNERQPVSPLNQSTLPGTQMAQSGPSMIQISSNRLVTPDISQPMTSMQQVGVSNNTTVNIPQSQPRVTASSSEFSIVYEGDLYVRILGHVGLITRIEGYRRGGSPEVFAFEWPKALHMVHLFPFNQNIYRNCTEVADYIVFRATRGSSFLQRMQADSVCARIELKWDMLFLIVIDELRLVGVLCPKTTSQPLERMLQEVPQERPYNQDTLMSLIFHQNNHACNIPMRQPRGSRLGVNIQPTNGVHTWLSQKQQDYVLLIQRHRQSNDSLEQWLHRQRFLSQLEQQPLFTDVQQEQLGQQQGRQQGQLDQEQVLGWGEQPFPINEHEWFRRVMCSLGFE